MAGRRFSMLVVGGLVVGGVGCTRNTNPPGFVPPAPPAAAAPGKSLWGGSSPQAAAASPGMGPAGNGVPVEAAVPRRPGQKLQPDTLTEFANTHVQVALGDPTPPNKDGLLDLARHRYQEALKQDPKHKGAMLGLARMHVQLGERDRAVAAFRTYLDVYPKDATVHHEAGLACARFQDWAGAVSWCEAALRLDPDNRTYRKTAGFCLARAGRWEEAFQAMSRVMPEAQARYNIARVLEHVNQPDASRQQLQLALRSNPDHADTRDFLTELDQSYPTAPAAGGGNPIQTVSGTNP